MDSASLHNDRNDYRGYYFLTAVVVLLLDQATKAMVSRTIPLYDSVPIVPRFFSITHVLNPEPPSASSPSPVRTTPPPLSLFFPWRCWRWSV